MVQNKVHHFWLMLASGPYDLEHNLPILRDIAKKLHHGRDQPVVTKLDSTRDLRGSLYARDDWRALHKKLCLALEAEFGTTFKDNGNSFNSCL